MSEEQKPTKQPLQRDWLLIGALAIGVAWTGVQWGQFRSVQDTVSTAGDRLLQMKTDAAAIQALRQAPETASDRARTNQELLGVVEQSLSAANISRENWQDSVPQPPRPVPNSPYRRATTRLYLDRLSLQQLAALSFDLQRRDETLSVSAIEVTRHAQESGVYDVELAVSYLIYAPS